MPIIEVKRANKKIAYQSMNLHRGKNIPKQMNAFAETPQHGSNMVYSRCGKREVVVARKGEIEQSSGRLNYKRRKHQVTVTTVVGKENAYVSTCQIKKLNEVESKHIAVIS